ncbi:sugar kinase [Alicyclobacillaceae bacterium I2511]|nr:sugar kinase [Alicyclobacillaceae bacterium I2511]
MMNASSRRPRQACSLGVDIGTTSVKVVAFNSSGVGMAHASVPLELYHPVPGAAEQDPMQVYEATMTAIQQVLGLLDGGLWQVVRVGFSAAMHSVVPIDEKNTPLCFAMTWMDTRASQVAEDLWASAEGPALYEKTGTPIHAMSPLCKLSWLRQQQPELFAQAYRFVSLKEWVWYQWFGKWEIDTSLASATGLYNLDTGDWDATALNRAGVCRDNLSRLVPTTFIRQNPVNLRLHKWGLAGDVIYSIGASDGVLANLGVGAIDEQTLVVTIGTSSAVRFGTLKRATDVNSRLFCYVLGDGRFVVGGPSNNGGLVPDWLYHHLLGRGSEEIAQDLGAALVQAGGVETEDLICLPYVAGERAPLWNAKAMGAVVGLRLEHGPLHLLRAGIEGVLLNTYWIADRIFRATGVHPVRLMASGKLLEVPWVRQALADIFNLPVYADDSTDASALGAVRLAEIAAGVHPWPEIRDLHGLGPPLLPTLEAHQAYEEKFEQFCRLANVISAGPRKIAAKP